MKTLLRFLCLLGFTALAVPAFAYYSVSVSAPGSATVSSSFYVSASGSDDFGEIESLTITLNGGYVCSTVSGGYTISAGGYATAPSSTGTATVQAELDLDYATAYSTAYVTITSNVPAITSPLSKTTTTGYSFTYPITATHTPTSFGASSLPSGLSVNTSTGLVTGSPSSTSVTTTNATISATNSYGTGSATLAITVNPPPPVLDSSHDTVPFTATGTAGTAATIYTIYASNSPTSYSAIGLPSGLSLSGAVISGTPTTAGIYFVTISASNITGYDQTTLIITIKPGAPVISGSYSVSATVGISFSYGITGSNSPTSYGATNLPPGLSVNTASGVISGIPTTSGTYSSIVLSATNASGTGTHSYLTITVAADSTAPSVPSGLSATDIQPTSFTLHWAPSTDASTVTNYQVQGTTSTFYTNGATQINLTGLVRNTTYHMQVQARDAAGNWSAWCTAFDVTTDADTDNDGLTTAEEAALGTSTSTTATPGTMNLDVHRPK